jgi:hypothetical protein
MLSLLPTDQQTGSLGVVAKIEERLKAAEERLKKLKAKHARTKARERTAASRTTRRDETRRTFLVGAVAGEGREGSAGGISFARMDGRGVGSGGGSGVVWAGKSGVATSTST